MLLLKMIKVAIQALIVALGLFFLQHAIRNRKLPGGCLEWVMILCAIAQLIYWWVK